MRMVLVTWLDACEYSDENARGEVEIGTTVETLGFVIDQNEAGIIITPERQTDSDDTFDHKITIPKAYIKSINDLSIKRKRKRVNKG